MGTFLKTRAATFCVLLFLAESLGDNFHMKYNFNDAEKSVLNVETREKISSVQINDLRRPVCNLITWKMLGLDDEFLAHF